MDSCAFGPKESLVDSRWYLVKEVQFVSRGSYLVEEKFRRRLRGLTQKNFATEETDKLKKLLS